MYNNSSYNRRAHRGHHAPTDKKPFFIIGIIIVAILLLIKIFSGASNGTANASTDFVLTGPGDTKSTIFIAPANGSRKPVTEAQKAFDKETIIVESGFWTGSIRSSLLDIDELTEMTYAVDSSVTPPNDKLTLSKGRVWVDSKSNNLSVELKNLTAKIPSGSVAMIEQPNIIHSVVYAIRGDVEIITQIGQQTLKAGEKITLTQSDINNSQTKLSELTGPIDSAIINAKIFTRNNGEELLKSAQSEAQESTNETTEETSETPSGSTTSTGSTGEKFINFTQPIDGSTLKTPTINIVWTLLSTDVARVTLNDADAVVSPVNENFTMEGFKLNSGVNNIVYKVYNAAAVELERGVLVVYGPNSAAQATTIVPENFPNLKDFVITAPKSNPYVTTEPYVKVQGIVPAKTVKYITVNNYRLQKFVPNSTTWYYHANASIGTIKEGTNLYHIKFYDANDKLIHTQVFTIIKDAKTPTQTSTTEDSPLFPAN